jgi:hypothetical protein
MIKISAQARWFNSDEGAVVLNLATGRYFNLNKTATAIWMALTEGVAPLEIEGRLQERFAVGEEQARADVSRFLDRLQKMGLLDGEAGQQGD